MNPNFQSPQSSPPGRMSQAENRRYRRQSLLMAAMKTVARYDIQGATVERICGEAGASRGLIAHYFESKEALLLAALKGWFNTAFAIKQSIADDPSQNAEQKILRISTASFTAPAYSWEIAAAWQAFTNASRHDRAFARSIRTASRNVRRLLEPLFEEAAKDAGVTLDPVLAARSLCALEDGLWNSLATGKDDMKVSDAQKACEQFIRGYISRPINGE
ncbi:MAG: TetR family transcriptional regulator C-terminal domain-containing protein [Pseudomonadota bacterium]